MRISNFFTVVWCLSTCSKALRPTPTYSCISKFSHIANFFPNQTNVWANQILCRGTFMIIYDHLCTSILALNAYSIIFAYSFLASFCKKKPHQLMFEMFAHQAFLTSDLHQIYIPATWGNQQNESRCGWNLIHSQGSMLWPEKLDGEISRFFPHFF